MRIRKYVNMICVFVDLPRAHDHSVILKYFSCPVWYYIKIGPSIPCGTLQKYPLISLVTVPTFTFCILLLKQALNRLPMAFFLLCHRLSNVFNNFVLLIMSNLLLNQERLLYWVSLFIGRQLMVQIMFLLLLITQIISSQLLPSL